MNHPDMKDAALTYAALGWKIFPCWWVDAGRCACGAECKSPGKHPIGQIVPGGQNNATDDKDVVSGWWTRYPRANIAVALQASGLCAVDCDPRNGGLETIDQLESKYGRIESDVMQFTGGGGWHAYFQQRGIVSLPGKLGPGVDMKHNGYTMVEPSNHVSGKMYGWEASSDPRDGIVPSPLPDWIRALANSSPHQITMGARSTRLIGPTVEEELRGALSFFPSDDRDTWVRIGLALRQCGQQGWDLWDEWSRSSEKYDPVDSLRVWHSMKPRGEVNYEAIFAVAAEHGWINPMKAAAQQADSVRPAEAVAPEPAKEIREEERAQAHECPVGILNRIAGWITQNSDQSHPLVSQAVAMSILSTAASRRYISEHGDPASIYIGILAPASSYGRSAFDAAETLMQHAGLMEMVRSVRISSPQQLFSALYQTPALMYLADDYGDQLRFARRQPSGLLEQALALLGGKIWSAPEQIGLDNWGEIGFKAGRDEEGPRPIFQRPTVNVLAMIAGSQIEQALKRSEYSRGAVDSMIFVPADNGMHWDDKPSRMQPPVDSAIHETLRRLRGFELCETACTREQLFGKLITTMPAMRTARVVGDLQGAQMAIAEQYRRRGPVARTLSIGARRNLARVCTVLAASANPIDPVVDQLMVDWASNFVRTMLDATIAVFRDRGGSDDGESSRPSVYVKVENYLRDCGASGASKRELVKNVRMFRDLTDEKRDELMQRMQKDGAVAAVARKGIRGHRFVHLGAEAIADNDGQSPTIADKGVGDDNVLIFKGKSDQSPTPTAADAGSLYIEKNFINRSASAMSAIANSSTESKS